MSESHTSSHGFGMTHASPAVIHLHLSTEECRLLPINASFFAANPVVLCLSGECPDDSLSPPETPWWIVAKASSAPAASPWRHDCACSLETRHHLATLLMSLHNQQQGNQSLQQVPGRGGKRLARLTCPCQLLGQAVLQDPGEPCSLLGRPPGDSLAGRWTKVNGVHQAGRGATCTTAGKQPQRAKRNAPPLPALPNPLALPPRHPCTRSQCI